VRTAGLFAALLAGLAACGDEPPPLQVPLAPVRAGQVCDTEERSRTALTIGGEPVGEEEVDRSQIRVLEANGVAATHVEVTYPVHTIDGKPGPLQGHSYDVRAAGGGGGVEVRRADGGELGDEERLLVVDDHRELGQPAALGSLLAARRWQRWRRVELGADELAALAKSRAEQGMKPVAGSFTWVGRHGDVATFVSTLEVLRDDGRLHVTARLDGVIEVDVRTGAVETITSRGTLQGEAQGAAPQTVRGTLDSTSTRRCR